MNEDGEIDIDLTYEKIFSERETDDETKPNVRKKSISNLISTNLCEFLLQVYFGCRSMQ